MSDVSVDMKLRPCLKAQWKNKSRLSALIKSGPTRLTFLISSLQGDESRCLDHNTDIVKSRGGKKAKTNHILKVAGERKLIRMPLWLSSASVLQRAGWTDCWTVYGFRKVRPSATPGEDVKKASVEMDRSARRPALRMNTIQRKRTARAKCSETPNITTNILNKSWFFKELNKGGIEEKHWRVECCEGGTNQTGLAWVDNSVQPVSPHPARTQTRRPEPSWEY